MSIKLTAQQKSKPIYTAQDVWEIMLHVHMGESKMRRLREYFWIHCCGLASFAFNRERYLQVFELLTFGSDNRVHNKPINACLKARLALRFTIYKNADCAAH